MAPLRLLYTLMLPLFATLQISFASASFGVERIPLGGSLFQLEARGLESRDDKGSDCDADPDCSPVDWGCQCGFTDCSWIDFTSSAATTATPTLTGPSTPTFTCSAIPTPIDPEYPCMREGFNYCANNGKCDWTSEPPAEDCCLDCM